jgi:phosphoenolpyruvate carboxykinase (ATP)
VNTGWTGGPFGIGQRINIAHTRAMIHAALNGKLSGIGFSTDPIFGFQIPQSCVGFPAEVLSPRNTWHVKAAYDRAAWELAGRFNDNFKQFAESVAKGVQEAGPKRNQRIT